jgi:putative endonuclease
MEVLKNYVMAYVIYAIKSSFDHRIYVGFTIDLEKRIKEHNQGRTKSTKGFRPWVLIYYETAETRTEAREREKYLKSGCGKEFLKKHILAP